MHHDTWQSFVAIALLAILANVTAMAAPPQQSTFMAVTICAVAVVGSLTADPVRCFELARANPVLGQLLPTSVASYFERHNMALGSAAAALAAKSAAAKSAAAGSGSTGSSSADAVAPRTVLEEVLKRTCWRFVLPCTLASVALQTILLLKPRYIGDVFDLIVKDGATMETVYWPYVRALVWFVFGEYALMTVRDWMSYGATHRFRRDTRTDMMANILRQDSAYLGQEGRFPNGLKWQMDVETDRLNGLVNGSVTKLLTGGITFIGGLYTVLQAEWPLALCGILLKAPILVLLHHRAHRDLAKYAHLYEASEGAANRVAVRTLQSAKTVQVVQAHLAEGAQVGEYRRRLDEYIDYLYLTHARQTALCFAGHLVGQIEDLLLMGIGFWLVLERRMTLGEYLTFRAHLNSYASGWSQLQAWYGEVTTVVHSAAAYFELMYRTSRIPPDNPEDLAPAVCRGELELRNVSFAFQSHPSLRVLQGVDLTLRPGAVVALVGRSGGGKSTIARLIQRFYDPTAGTLALDGVDLVRYNVAWLRRRVRCVEQEPFLFDLSIEDNIALGLSGEHHYGDEKPEEKGEDEVGAAMGSHGGAQGGGKGGGDRDTIQAWRRRRVVEAAKLSQAHEFITSACAHGYETLVGDGGMRLSGGQKQRIAIARALISRPQILVLDEATAALDTETEAQVMAKLFRAMHAEKMSVLIIAHRLSTVRHADEINVVTDGKVVERGSHGDLVARGGHYADLVRASEADVAS